MEIQCENFFQKKEEESRAKELTKKWREFLRQKKRMEEKIQWNFSKNEIMESCRRPEKYKTS